ncbi:MAG: B12-binding domain-containing protein [Gammaproteobacteria bacterium]
MADESASQGVTGDDSQNALLRAIEAQIIPRLVLAHRNDAAPDPATCPSERDAPDAGRRPTSAEITEFTRIVLRGDIDAAGDALRRLQARGIPIESLYLDLLSPAARQFGQMWESEQADFVDVTLALHRLQKLAHDLSADFVGAAENNASPSGPRALCVALPGEQHVFGAQLVGEFLRRARWDVWDAPGATERDILGLAEREWFTLIGVSISTAEQFDALAALVRHLRRVSLNPDLRIMVGGRPFEEHPEWSALVGADATARDGRDAVVKARGLLDLTHRRN